MTKEISNKIKFYNLILIVLIFMYHSDGKYYLHIGPYLEVLGTMGLSFFFITSAFFMFRGLRKDNLGKRILKRFKTILVPYLFWNLLFFAVFAIRDIYVRQTPLKTVLYRIAFQPYNDVMWYLSALFVFSLLAGPLFYVMRNKLAAISFLAVSSGLVIFFFILHAEDVVAAFSLGWWVVKIFKYLPIYFLGGYIGFYHSDRLKTGLKTAPLFLLLTLIILLLMVKFDYIGALYWILWILSPIAAWFSVPESMFKRFKVMDAICEPSFFMYVFQLMDFYIWQWIFEGRFSSERTYNLAILGASFITVYVLFYILKLVFPRLLGIATGFRSGKEPVFSVKKRQASIKEN